MRPVLVALITAGCASLTGATDAAPDRADARTDVWTPPDIVLDPSVGGFVSTLVGGVVETVPLSRLPVAATCQRWSVASTPPTIGYRIVADLGEGIRLQTSGVRAASDLEGSFAIESFDLQVPRLTLFYHDQGPRSSGRYWIRDAGAGQTLWYQGFSILGPFGREGPDTPAILDLTTCNDVPDV